MALLVLAIGIVLASGCAALAASPSPRWATRFGVGGVITGSVLGLVPTLSVLLGAPMRALYVPWHVPYGSFFVELDALSAFFVLPTFLLSSLTAMYGAEYWRADQPTKSLGPPWFFFNLLVASMILVLIARNGVLFLTAWEVMALASFFLVTCDHEQARVRDAGWTYLVATHLGAACVLVLFVLLGRQSGSLDFDRFHAPSALSGVLFMLAVIGFGSKAGFMPFHVWLPEAHPAAPSHVSALMSGVMIKTGVYGLLRMLTFLGPPSLWWGELLCAIGLLSGIVGIIFALAQHDLKRLLAYSSVENVGIITMGLGVGLLGMSTASPMLTVLGFSGALLHVVNHAFFKGLLFLGAGAVAHATGTREMDRLGGLLKTMPWTGSTFLLGAIAITGLPPLNGFVGEFVLYMGAFRGVQSFAGITAATLVSIIAGLSLIGGLAAACFTMAGGTVFLGEPRSSAAEHSHDPGLCMRLPLVILAVGCVALSLFSPVLLEVLTPTLERITGLSAAAIIAVLTPIGESLSVLVVLSGVLLLLITGLMGVRHRLLATHRVDQGVTWDCGYAQPTPRMQYTASSFTQPLTDRFALLLRSTRTLVPPHGLFPRDASLRTETEDLSQRYLFAPAFTAIGRGLSFFRWLQQGQIQLYVLYIALTLLALLVWKLG